MKREGIVSLTSSIRSPGWFNLGAKSYSEHITMKGPWESIAVGLEKGHKTQKLEKVANHSSKRVGERLEYC